MFKGEYEDWAEKYGPYMYKADDYFEMRQYKKTIACLDECLKIDPNDAELWFYKGRALRFLGFLKESFEYFKKAAKLDPYDVEYLGMEAGVAQELLNPNGINYTEINKIDENNATLTFKIDRDIKDHEKVGKTYELIKKLMLGSASTFTDHEINQFLSKVDYIYITFGDDAYFEEPSALTVGINASVTRICNIIKAIIYSNPGAPVKALNDYRVGQEIVKSEYKDLSNKDGPYINNDKKTEKEKISLLEYGNFISVANDNFENKQNNKPVELEPLDLEPEPDLELESLDFENELLIQEISDYEEIEEIQNNDLLKIFIDVKIRDYEESRETHELLKRVLLDYTDDEGNSDTSLSDAEKIIFLFRVNTIYITSGDIIDFKNPDIFIVGIQAKQSSILYMIHEVINTPQGKPVMTNDDYLNLGMALFSEEAWKARGAQF